MRPLAAALAQVGIATWLLEYRRLGETGGGWPGTFLDVGAGMDALRDLARIHRLDLARVVALGHSAGGHLALWLASRARLPADAPLSTPDPLAPIGVLALAPVADLQSASALGLSRRAVDQLLGGAPDHVPERYALTSPMQRLPLGIQQVVIHGTADVDVPLELSQRYAAAARDAGDAVELLELPGTDHFQIVEPGAAAFAATREASLRLVGGTPV